MSASRVGVSRDGTALGAADSGVRVVRTVLGDIDPAELGECDYHEHLFQVSPLLVGDELNDEVASGGEAEMLRRSGFAAMVDATPIGLGRNLAAVARISASTGLRIVHTTGAHHSGHYEEAHWLRTLGTAQLTELFVAEVRDGILLDGPDGAVGAGACEPAQRPDRTLRLPDGTAVRAGLVKAGITYWKIGAFERRVVDAAAQTSATTGVSVMVHLEHGSASHEVLDVIGEQGVSADRVILAHADRNLDPGLHAELAARGAYLGYDGMARHVSAPDSAILDCAEAVVAAGGGGRLLLGGDVARRNRFIAYGGMPGLQYLGDRFVPRLRERIGDDATNRMLVANPRDVLSFASG